ncbi:MAG TPA: NAD(P)H-hydrate dehydratase [Tepidisphaeraceae bacterium]|nr:NAD(P)H-hydrate dehydratase [Tepidisphaeraceae bacterium]
MNRIVTLSPLPDRPLEGHKGLFGRVLVVGGSDSMIGAPVLAGTAALRMGAGLVQIAMPRAVLATAISITPELIGLPLSATSARQLLTAAEAADVLAIGPGMGTSSAARSRLMQLIRLEKPAVIDADALNLLVVQKQWPRQFKLDAVLTPHPGEMKRLAKLFGRANVPADDDGRIEIALLAAKKFGQIVVLKGNRTIVTDGKQVYVNRTGDSSLSKAGTGDVLTGIIASLIGQKMNRFQAACTGVWLHGKAGEIAGQSLGRRSVLARDVIDSLPRAIRVYESQAG